jgi:cytochrome c oxidase subunit 2
MNFGEHAGSMARRSRLGGLRALCLAMGGFALALMASPDAALAQAKAPEAAVAAPVAPLAAPAVQSPATSESPAAAQASAAPEAAAGTYVRMAPTPGKGMPVDGGIGLQAQYSPLGDYARWIHDDVLMPIITVITIFVLALLLWVIVRYRRGANPVASKTSHNTAIEIAWTLVPVLILVGIAVPSIDLLAKQFKPAPEKALTVKITGNQWYWTYAYPDNGGVELTSYMLNTPDANINTGVRMVGSDPSDGPEQLEVDNRLVLPVGEPIRLQITAADVIHAFAVPSLWFKLDAVPGRINEKVLFISEPGVYYGQCSELCGARHGYMPIAIEALPRDKFNAWLLSQPGGTLEAASAAATPAAAPAAAPSGEASAAAPAPAA